MNYQFVVELPKHLEAAYKAGEIIITGGVARYANGGTIAAHLEQVAPLAINTFGASNPYVAVANIGLQAAKAGKGMVIDTAKLNQIINLVQKVKALSTVNLAISGATLGVVVVGFAVVLHQMNKLDKKVDQLSSQLQTMNTKVSDLHKNEISKLIAKVKKNIKHCITFIHQLEDLGWNSYLDIEISKTFDEIESLMEMLIYKYTDRDSISISLDLSQCLYNAYANLLKAYLTNRYLHRKSLDYLTLRFETLKNFSSQLSSPDMIDELYEQYLFNQEQRFSENELDVILSLYKFGCRHVNQEVHNHHEIVTTTPLRKFKKWQRLLQSSKEPLIWIDHSD